MKLKNKKTLISIVVLIGIFVTIGIFMNSKTKTNIDYVMTIDNLAVAKDEVNIVVNTIKSKHKNNLITTYKISSNEFDWNKDYGNKKGYQYLIDDLINQLSKLKVIQSLAIEASILDDFNYEIFLNMLEDENKTRNEKLTNNEAVYGLKQFNKKQYYDYLNNNLFLKVKSYLIENKKVNINETDIKKTYQNNKTYFNNAKLDDVKDSVKSLCYEEKINKYIEEKVKEVKKQYNQEQLKKDVLEMIK